MMEAAPIRAPDKDSGGSARRRVAFAYTPSQVESVFSPASIESLTALCDIVDSDPLTDFNGTRAKQVLGSTDVLVTGWGCPKIDRAVLEGAPYLRLIAHAAGSIKGFITPDVFAAGIAVCNAADANAIPVAEFTLAAILFANKQVVAYRDRYRAERDALRPETLSNHAIGNWHKIIGIVGYSRIGRRVVELLKHHDFRILVHDPYLTETDAREYGVESVSLDALMEMADVVSLHAPSLETTRHMIDARRLALMRDGTTLINTARGAIVDQDALVRELETGRISAIIDVTVPERLPADSPLYTLPNVLLTPHIAGAMGGERERLGALVVAEIERFIRGIPLAHAIFAETLHLQA